MSTSARTARPAAEALSIFERAKAVFPGGNTRLNAFELPVPMYAASGQGCYVWDVEGRSYVDFVNNFTTLLHGHAYDAINAAIREQLQHGLCFSVGTDREVDLAEIIVARIPAVSKIRFANSGTEAVMYAIKAARAFTEKSGIARCEGAWHGAYDWAEISTAPTPSVWGNDPRSLPMAKGTPSHVVDDVTVIPFNDIEATERILKSRLETLGAVLVDPLPSRIGMIPISNEYADFLNRFCREHGVILIADEVLCNRIGYAGASARLGLEPDLITLGKIYGGGLPIGVFGGREDVMAMFDPMQGPAVPHSGTFVANAVTMVAGRAALEAWTPAAVDRLNELGARFRAKLNEGFVRLGAQACVTGDGSLFKIHPKAKQPNTFREGYATPTEAARLKELIAAAKERGYLLMSTGGGCLSTPMDETILDRFTDVLLHWASSETK